MESLDIFKICKEFLNKGKTKTFSKGETIIFEESKGFHVYFILEGEVNVVFFTPSGKKIILSTLQQGTFFGEMAVLDELPRSATVEAKTSCKILELSKNDFLYILQKNPQCTLAILKELCQRLRNANAKIRLLSIPSAEDRLKEYIELLWAKAKQQNKPLSLPSHSQIASEIGLSRETVSRTLKKLKLSGWLNSFLED